MPESLMELWRAGGYVLVTILLLSTVAWLLLALKFLEYFSMRSALSRTRTSAMDVASSCTLELLARMAADRPDQRRALEKLLSPVLGAAAEQLERHLGLIAALAAVLPLLGLLGTVLGMVNTFEVITLHGTGEPRLLAHGIRQALVTTEAGLSAALPILLAHHYLAGQAGQIEGELRLTAHHLAQARHKA